MALSDSDAEKVLQDIGAMFILYSKPLPTAALLNMLVDDVEAFGIHVVQKAMKRLRVTYDGRSPITSALLISACESVCGRLSGDEAWALALRVRDENKTVVWNDEVAKAWGMAAELLRGRADLVGARRAFLESYERICHAKRESGALPVAEFSLGSDKDSHAAAIAQAKELGIDVSRLQDTALGVALASSGGVPVLGFSPVELRLGHDPRLKGDESESEEEARAREALRRANLARLKSLRDQLKAMPGESAKREEARRNVLTDKWLAEQERVDKRAKLLHAELSEHRRNMEKKQATKQRKAKASKQAI